MRSLPQSLDSSPVTEDTSKGPTRLADHTCVVEARLSRDESGWALEAAEARVKRTNPATNQRWVRRAFEADGPSSPPVVLSLLVVSPFVLWSVLAEHWSPSFLPGLAPGEPEGALTNLWQVHGAIVALSIPLLVLLLEQAQSSGAIGTTAGQAMVAHTNVVFTAALSLWSVLVIGAVAIYIPSHGGLLASALLSVVSIALLGRGYWRSIRLLTTVRVLRNKSESLLVRRLQDRVRKQFATSLANRLLTAELGRWKPGAIRSSTEAGADLELARAQVDGVVADINLRHLRLLLERAVDPIDVDQPLVDAEEPSGVVKLMINAPDGRVLMVPIGERVRRGNPLLAVRGSSVKISPADLLALVSIENGDPVEQSFRDDLRSLRDQLLTAVDSSVLGDVEDGLRLYGSLLGRVLEERSRIAGALGVPAPPSWFNNDGPEIEWLIADLRAVIERAWRHADPGVLREVSSQLSTLLDTLRRAGESGGHANVLRLAVQFWARSLDDDASSAVSIAAGRSLLISLRSYAEFLVLPDESPDGDGMPYLGQVFDTLMGATQVALMANPERAAAPLIEADQLIQSVRLQGSPGSNLSGSGRFEAYASGYVAGVAALVLMLRSESRMSDQTSQALIRRTRAVLDRYPASYWAIPALDRFGEDYPWSEWEIQLWPDGKTGGTLGEMLDWIRVFAFLDAARRGVSGLTAPADVEGRRFDTFDLRQMVKTWEDRYAPWLHNAVPDMPTPEQLETTKGQVEALVNEMSEVEADERAGLELESDKVKAFYEAVETSWRYESKLRGPLEPTGDLDGPPAGSWGYNSYHQREFFTSAPGVLADPDRLGASIGGGLARSEINQVVHALSAAETSEATLEDLRAAVRRDVAVVRGLGHTPTIVVIGSWEAVYRLAGESEPDAPVFEGVPIEFEYADKDARCFVVDLDAALRVSRGCFDELPADAVALAGGQLLASVVPIAGDEAVRLITEHRVELTGTGGNPLDQHDQIRQLRRMVHIRAFSRFSVELIEATAVRAIRVVSQADPDVA